MKRHIFILLAIGLLAISWHLHQQTFKLEKPPVSQSSELKKEDHPAATKAIWPHQSSDIPVDAQAQFGILNNGMKFIIYPHNHPQGKVSLRLHVAAGSMMEEEDQRGLAHFLEHMLFNGSKNFKPGELIPEMQRRGIAFGPHINAYTSFDETVYQLDLPDNSQDTLELCFKVMRDYADGALISPEEVEKERGVILAEKNTRDSIEMRLMEQQFQTLMPDHLISKRFPIGTEEVIRTAPAQRLVDFYKKYYVPELMTFVVCGDIDAVAMKAKISSTFDSMQASSTEVDRSQWGEIKPLSQMQAHVFTDPEVKQTSLALTFVKPFNSKLDTLEKREAEIEKQIASMMINDRLDRQSKEPNAPFTKAVLSFSSMTNLLEYGDLSIDSANNDWKPLIPILEQTIRGAIEFGFFPNELETVKAEILSFYKQNLDAKSTRKSNEISNQIIQLYADKKVITDPSDEYEIIQKFLSNITTEKCAEAFRKAWHPQQHLILTAALAAPETRDELMTSFQASQKTPLSKPMDQEKASFAYHFQSDGAIASKKEITSLNFIQYTLPNHVKINIKPSDLDKNQVFISARIGNGQLSQPKGYPLLNKFAETIVNASGLGKHSPEQLKSITAGKNVSLEFKITNDAFIYNAACSTQDLEFQLQYLTAAITDPGIRTEGEELFKKNLPTFYNKLKYSIAGAKIQMNEWLMGQDDRFSVPPLESLQEYTLEQVSKWIKPILQNDYLEISIIGDLDLSQQEKLITGILGALPNRNQALNQVPERAKIQLPETPIQKNFTYTSELDLAQTVHFIPTFVDQKDYKTMRRLVLLSDVLSDKLREEIREALGATYSPTAAFKNEEGLERINFIILSSSVKAEHLDKVTAATKKTLEDIYNQGISQDLFQRMKTTLSVKIDDALKQNEFWLDRVLFKSQAVPHTISATEELKNDIESITLEEINALAKEYLSPKNTITCHLSAEQKSTK